MKIKWTSIHRVVAGNPTAPWVSSNHPERPKRQKRDAGKEKEKDERGPARPAEGGRK